MSLIYHLLPVFEWVLWTSAKVSVLIIFLLLLKYLFRNKLGATVNYLLWSVVIVGLLLPWSPPSALSIYNLAGLSTPNAIHNLNRNLDSTAINPESYQKVSGNTSISFQNNTVAETEIHPAAEQSEVQNKIHYILESPLTHLCLFLIWILGVVAFIISIIVVNQRFARCVQGQTLKHWQLLDSLDRVRVLTEFEHLKAGLHIKGDVSLILTQSAGTPALFGLYKPRLLLPVSIADSFSSEQLNHVLVHELLHFKRKDIFVNWLVQALLILHWFNPVIWYALARLREDQESACDALAVSYFGVHKAKNYAGTLIKLLESYARPSHMAGLACLSGSKAMIKRRIVRISNRRQSSLAYTVSIVAMALLIGFSTLTDAKMLPAAENNLIPLSAATEQTAVNQGAPFPFSDQSPGSGDQQAISLLPTSVQAIAVSDDSPAGSFWSPQSQDVVLSQVSSWLKEAKAYTGTIPHSDYVGDAVHHNIGPSALHLTGPDRFETLIYPAWYVQTSGRKAEADSLEEDIHYQQDVVVFIEGGTNSVHYFESAPLYRWLKDGEWKTEFRPNPALAPLYRTNENGRTYGTDRCTSIIGNPEPDLIAAINQDGVQGYVKYEDINGPQPKTPEEAIAMQAAGKFIKKEIPLYAADGKTVLGSF